MVCGWGEGVGDIEYRIEALGKVGWDAAQEWRGVVDKCGKWDYRFG